MSRFLILKGVHPRMCQHRHGAAMYTRVSCVRVTVVSEERGGIAEDVSRCAWMYLSTRPFIAVALNSLGERWSYYRIATTRLGRSTEQPDPFFGVTV